MRHDRFQRPKFVRDLGTNRPQMTGEYEPVEYTTTAAFKAYVKSIESLIKRSGRRGVTTAEIHAALGREHQAWTIEAIRHIADVAESWTILPTRYSIQQHREIRRAPYGAVQVIR
jgi:hypothetical protein